MRQPEREAAAADHQSSVGVKAKSEHRLSLFTLHSSPFHHAWWIAFAAGLVMFVQGGLGSYALGVLLPAWVDEFGWPRSQISLAYTIGTLLPGLTGVIVGRWTDRFGPRWIIVAGAAVTGASFLLLATVNSILWFFFAFFVGAIGRCGTGNVPVSAAIARWFTARRSLAMGLATTGISLAGVILVPLATWLIVNFGWRLTVVALGLAVWILVIPVVWLVMSGSPADRGMTPYGADRPAVESKRSRRPAPEYAFDEIYRSPVFWLTAIALTFGVMGSNSIGIHAIPALLDKGVRPEEAALAISVMAALATLGKLVFGWLGDRFSIGLLLAIAMTFQATGFALLGLAAPGLGVWLFAIIYGASLGGTVALQGVIVADRFGVKAYGAIYGAIGLPMAISSAISPVIAGGVRDVVGTYATAFLLFAFLNCVGALFLGIGGLVAARLPRREPAVT